MARPKILTDQQKVFIIKLCMDAREHGIKLTTKDVVRELTTSLVENERKLGDDAQYEDLKKRVEEKYISVSAIQKFLTQSNSDVARDELNKPWNLALMNNPDYAINPQALPSVIKVMRFQQQKTPSEEVTRRQVKWIDYLHYLVTNVEDLQYISMLYAMYENICDMAHISFDTSKLDMMLPDSEKVTETFRDILSVWGIK